MIKLLQEEIDRIESVIEELYLLTETRYFSVHDDTFKFTVDTLLDYALTEEEAKAQLAETFKESGVSDISIDYAIKRFENGTTTLYGYLSDMDLRRELMTTLMTLYNLRNKYGR